MKKDIPQRVEELEARYRLIADNLVDAIWVMDVQTFTYDFITPSIEKISGYPAEEFIGVGVSKRVTPETFRVLKEALDEEVGLSQQGITRKRTMEIEMIHKQGHTYWVEITAKFIKDDNGRLKVAGVSKEISHRKRAEREREALIQKLGRALAEKENLIKENKLLRSLLPICAGCKRIRDEDGRWWPLDAYIKAHTNTDFTHTICEECQRVYYGDIM